MPQHVPGSTVFAHQRPALLLLLIALTICWGGAAASAQTVGSIEGVVKDSSDGTLPGATVAVTNEQTGISRTLVTDADGRYRARDLALGQYRLEARLAGFQSVRRQGVVLTIGREAVVDLTLPIGTLSDSITVTGDAPLVNTTSSEQTALVAREQMENLPLGSRDFSQLITLQAAVRLAEE